MRAWRNRQRQRTWSDPECPDGKPPTRNCSNSGKIVKGPCAWQSIETFADFLPWRWASASSARRAR